MRSAAPTLVNLGFSGGVIQDFDTGFQNTVADGSGNYFAVGEGMPLQVPGSSARLLTQLSLANCSHLCPANGKPWRAFEVQSRLAFNATVAPQGPVQNWGAPMGQGALWIDYYAVSSENTGALTIPTKSTGGVLNSASDAVDAAVTMGRLLDRLAVVDRVPVSWTLQPGERLIALAGWSGWDFASNANGPYFAWVSSNVTCEQQA